MTTQDQSNKPGETQTRPVKSDKEMLQSEGGLPKHASYKFFFRSDMDAAKARAYWNALLASDALYDSNTFNCHMPVANALIQAFAGKIAVTSKGHVAEKTAMKLVSSRSGALMPETTNNAAWSVAKMARLCAIPGQRDRQRGAGNGSKVIVRQNLFNETDGTVTKHDYAARDVDFLTDLRTGKMSFAPTGSPGKVNPRHMSSESQRREMTSDAKQFDASSIPAAASSSPTSNG